MFHLFSTLGLWFISIPGHQLFPLSKSRSCFCHSWGRTLYLLPLFGTTFLRSQAGFSGSSPFWPEVHHSFMVFRTKKKLWSSFSMKVLLTKASLTVLGEGGHGGRTEISWRSWGGNQAREEHVGSWKRAGELERDALGASRHVWAASSQENGPNKSPFKSSFQNRGFWPLIEPCLSGQVREPCEGDSGRGNGGGTPRWCDQRRQVNLEGYWKMCRSGSWVGPHCRLRTDLTQRPASWRDSSAPWGNCVGWLELKATFGVNGRSTSRNSQIMAPVEYFQLSPEGYGE